MGGPAMSVAIADIGHEFEKGRRVPLLCYQCRCRLMAVEGKNLNDHAMYGTTCGNISCPNSGLNEFTVQI